MSVEIKKKTKKDFEAAAKKLGISPEIPGVANLRPDLALYVTAVYMLAVLIEAGKNGNIHDITDHSVRKYEPIHHAKEGYVPGSSGGGFSYHDYDFGHGCTCVGARLSSNSWKECKENAEKYPDLWEIFTLNVR